MTPGSLFRLGGWLLCIGAMVSIVTNIAGSVAYTLSADQTSPLWISIQVISIVAALLFSLGLPAAYCFQAYETRQTGLWGFVLTEAATSIGGIGYSLVITIVTSTLSSTVLKQDTHLAYGLYALSTVSSLFLFAGTALFGYASLKGNVFPRNACMLLLAGCIISLAQAYPDPVVGVSLGLLSQVCTYGAFLWMGSVVIRQSHFTYLPQASHELEQRAPEAASEEMEAESALETLEVEATFDQNN